MLFSSRIQGIAQHSLSSPLQRLCQSYDASGLCDPRCRNRDLLPPGSAFSLMMKGKGVSTRGRAHPGSSRGVEDENIAKTLADYGENNV